MRVLRKYTQPAKVIKPSYTKQKFIEDITNDIEIDGFFGGIERTLADVEDYIITPATEAIVETSSTSHGLVTVEIQPAQEAVTLLNKYMFIKSLDGLMVAIYIADPLSYDNGVCVAQLPHSSWETLNKFINAISKFDGVSRVEASESILTKSEFQSLVMSDKYRATTEEPI